jgi:nucleotide-binding universal stress UspA family protein
MPGMSFKKILLAVDQGTVAAHAADVGASVARALGAEVGFVYGDRTRAVGSVAEAVGRHAHCSVLVVRTPD